MTAGHSAPAMPTRIPPASARPTVRPIQLGSVTVDPPVFQAPMAGFSNYAYRHIVRQLGGAGLLATEMVSAAGFAWMDRQGAGHPDRLWGVKDEPRPLAVQIWDNDPEMLALVATRLAHEYRVSVVDINFGCPVRRISEKAQSGSYLLKDPDRVGTIVERVVGACRPTPVTAKIRLGCSRDTINAIDVAQAVEGAGGAALTVHGRTAQDYFRGEADWDRIAQIKPHLTRIPLIGNGDLDSVPKVLHALHHYGVDGVMIARAALGKPWLFRQVQAALRGLPIPPDPPLDEQRDLMLLHYRLICDRFGEDRGTLLMGKYACCYAQGRPSARRFRAGISHARTRSEFHQVVDMHFPRGTNDRPGTHRARPERSRGASAGFPADLSAAPR